MYHYIRNYNKKFPYANILTINNFKRQINKFCKIGLIDEYKSLSIPSNKTILTFDDGLKDHLYAAEILKNFKCIGIFFIPSLPYLNNEILDVHKTHLICQKISGSEIIKALDNYLKKKKILNYINTKEKEKFKKIYTNVNDNNSIKKFKLIINYCSDLNISKKILKYLVKFFDIKDNFKSFYLSKKEIVYMKSLGMIIGAHSNSHTVLSRLNYRKQFLEINTSKHVIENIIKKEVNMFSYPFGLKDTYNSSTLSILKRLKFKQAYCVKSKNISNLTLQEKKFELPRYDCNQF